MPQLRKRLTLNPFMEDLGRSIGRAVEIKRHRLEMKLYDMVNGEEVQVEYPQEVEKLRDNRAFVKIFITRESMEKMHRLPSGSYHLFWWIAENLQWGRDDIVIFADKAKDDLGYSSMNSIHKAVKGLEEAGFIAPKEGGAWLYFINPLIFFFGDPVPVYQLWYGHNAIKKNFEERYLPKVKEIEPVKDSMDVLPIEFMQQPEESVEIDKEDF